MSMTDAGAEAIETLMARVEMLRVENQYLHSLIMPNLSAQFGMTQGEWRLLCIILQHSPISKERLYALYYWGYEDPPDDGGIPVLIHRVRKKLISKGITIQTLSRWGYDAAWEEPWSMNPLVQMTGQVDTSARE